MRMFNPPHPGEILKEDVLPELGITVWNFAAHLSISRPHLSKVLNGRAIINAEMDLKLSEAFGQPPGLWIIFIGFLNEYPEYQTQGLTKEELIENLKDLF